MKFRIAGIVQDSIVDGPGVRMTVFAQGCHHNCKGCHNPQTHSLSGGRETTTEEVIAQMHANTLLDGLTLSGGEPFLQPRACSELAKAAHDLGLNVWCYTGYTLEQIRMLPEAVQELLRHVDVLVDGPFILEQRSLDLEWRGSKNQRIIEKPWD